MPWKLLAQVRLLPVKKCVTQAVESVITFHAYVVRV